MLLVIDGIITIWKLEVSFLSSILYVFIYTYMYIYIYQLHIYQRNIYLSIYIYTHMYLYISPKIKKTKQIKSNFCG